MRFCRISSEFMKTYFDCIPCFLKQTLEAVRFVIDDENIQENVLRQILKEVSAMDLNGTPPEMGWKIHKMVQEVTGNSDPYREIKQASTRFVLSLMPKLRAVMADSADPFETAVRLSIAGNIIDMAIMAEFDTQRVYDALDHALSEPLNGELKEFRAAAASAKSILFLADNAGEIVFDRFLLEQLGLNRITFVVKGSPIINDATLEDAVESGLTDMVEVMDNGSDAPGTILESCSPEFKEKYESTDLIVAKGQANYETLSDIHRPIAFVLKAKCPVICKDIGCEPGSLIVRTRGL